MTDSATVFPPGFRLTDSATGAPIVGATIAFFDAGTTNPKTVYADKDLLVALGTSVITDSLGCPTSDGTTKTDVYVGTALYKVTITDANAVVIETKDNRPGAVVSASSANVAVTALFPVVTKSLAYTVLQADQNTTFKINCTAGDVTLTLPSAVPGVGTGNVSAAGWKIKVQHAGSANQVLLVVASGSGQLISEGSKSFGGGYALGLNGEDLELTSDGGNWAVTSHTTPFIKLAQGIIPITDQLATSPGSPVQGSLYLLTGNGGSWSAFAAKDIAQYTGTTWVNFTPYTDCGWTVYVADENRNYQYVDSAWVAQPLSTPATQTTMEASTAGTPVTADMQKYHPLSAKAWGYCTVSGGVVTLVTSAGVSGIVRNSTGSYTVTLSPAMSSGNFAPIAQASGNSNNVPRVTSQPASASTFNMSMLNQSGSNADPDNIQFVIFGDQ